MADKSSQYIANYRVELGRAGREKRSAVTPLLMLPPHAVILQSAVSQPIATIFAAFVAAVIGAVGSSIVSWLLNRKRTALELQKLTIEIRNLSEAVNYSLPASSEDVLYDGRARVDGFDFKGHADTSWHDNQPSSARAIGEMTIDEGHVINVSRENTDGRFQLFLQQYTYRGRPLNTIPANMAIGGKRKLRINCEAKTVGGAHRLRFILRNPATGKRLAEDTKSVAAQDWVPIEIFLQIDPTEDCQLRIDDEALAATSSVQIRSLLLSERTV